jgi:hypothetical protein
VQGLGDDYRGGIARRNGFTIQDAAGDPRRAWNLICITGHASEWPTCSTKKSTGEAFASNSVPFEPRHGAQV